MMTHGFPLPPGSTIGILGGGQLGPHAGAGRRAAGLRRRRPDARRRQPRRPGRRPHPIVAAYDDPHGAGRAWPRSADVVTFEFENVPAGVGRAAGRRWAPRSRPARAPWPSPRTGWTRRPSSTRVGVPTVAFAAVDSRGRHRRRRCERLGAPGAAEDPPRGLRRQGPGLGRARRRRRGRLRRARRRARHPRGQGRLRARAVGDRRARPRRRDRRLSAGREPPRGRHPAPHHRARRRRAGRRADQAETHRRPHPRAASTTSA